MNTQFTSAEIARAGQIVKQARASAPVNVDAGIQSMMGPGSYDAWLGPKSIIDPVPPPRPGFWASLGRSVMGAADRGIGGIGLAPLRGFVGLGPGDSGLGTILSAAPGWTYDKITGNRAGAADALDTMRQGLSVPTQNARAQSEPYHFALADYFSREHPDATRRLTMPWATFKNYLAAPTVKPKLLTPEVPSWKEHKMPPIPKPTW